jgi:hypothetical protein
MLKHYAPWVGSRHEQLKADLSRAWSRDPLVVSQSGVHQRYIGGHDSGTHLIATLPCVPAYGSNVLTGKVARLQKAPIELRRRRYAVVFVGLEK